MLLNCILYHEEVWITFARTHYRTHACIHASIYIYIYTYIYTHTHTHIWCNSLEYGYQTFEDVYISHTQKFKNLCSACVHLSTTHQHQYWGLAMGWMPKEQQFDSGCELQIYLLYQDIHSSFGALSALYPMVPGGKAVGHVSYLSPSWMTMFETCGTKPPFPTYPRCVHET